MNDPKDNTTIQRAWLPFKDKAIVVAERNIDINNTINSQKGFISANPLNTYKNNIKQTFNYDIATSLAVGGKLFVNFNNINYLKRWRILNKEKMHKQRRI